MSINPFKDTDNDSTLQLTSSIHIMKFIIRNVFQFRASYFLCGHQQNTMKQIRVFGVPDNADRLENSFKLIVKIFIIQKVPFTNRHK
jgi:hypothetical protein